jgi:hypothetical protein
MKTFAVTGRCIAAPPPADWREQLARMMGAKPRRIGDWAELGLYGALSCMADAGEKTLVPDAQIWLGSLRGTYAATAIVLDQLREDLPMPLAFLQTQPSQLLSMLAMQMNWKGHACFVAGPEPQALMRLAGAQAGAGGVLLGWLDEVAGGETLWLRLKPCEDVPADIVFSKAALFSAQTSHVCLTGNGLELKQAAQVRL